MLLIAVCLVITSYSERAGIFLLVPSLCFMVTIMLQNRNGFNINSKIIINRRGTSMIKLLFIRCPSCLFQFVFAIHSYFLPNFRLYPQCQLELGNISLLLKRWILILSNYSFLINFFLLAWRPPLSAAAWIRLFLRMELQKKRIFQPGLI